MYAYPLDASIFYQGAEQVGKGAFFVEVESVVSDVLSDEYQLFDAFGGELSASVTSASIGVEM